ncbi:4-vinyl reductase, partial [Thermodesulfobacteriota bacterium]
MNQMEIDKYSDSPLYNIRILKSYIYFLQKKYPEIDIDKILNYAEVTKLQLNDPGYWYTQGQANRFQEIVVELTGNKNISRDAGRYLIETQSVIAQYISGFNDPTSAASQIETIYSKLSLAAEIWVEKLEKNKFEYITKPNSGVEEQLFQCENRIGSLEGLLKLFLGQYPEIDHPECYHRGAKHCRYVVSWGEPSTAFKWLRIRNHSILIGLLLSVLSFFLLPLSYFILIPLICLSLSLAITHKVQTLEREKLTRNVDKIGRAAEDLLNELNVRYNVTKLVQEVGEITSVIQNEKEIASAVAISMRKYLDYDRGAILLA